MTTDIKPVSGACVVGQSGGPTAVINSSLYGVVKTALEADNITRVLGAEHGIAGVIKGRLFDMGLEDPEELRRLMYTPSSALGSCRYKMADPETDSTDYDAILEVFKKYDVRYFYYIGGNDSMDTCNKLSKYMKTAGYECYIIGVPKTIDNDLFGTDHCPGYGSAAKYIATTCMEIHHDATVYDSGMITIIEIMGRNAGWLTAAAHLARHCGAGPDLIYLPEVPFDMNEFITRVTDLYRQKRKVIAAVSEGIRDRDGKYISEYGSPSSAAKDAFGHLQMGGLAARLAAVVKEKTDAKVRGIELSLLQRCSAHCASGRDIGEAFTVGKHAVEKSLEGVSGGMVALRRVPGDNYVCEPFILKLEKVANVEKKVPAQWITDDGSGVTDMFLEYALPLIAGETNLDKEHGLPRFARLKKVLV